MHALAAAGPAASGYAAGRWNSASVQGLIAREFGVLYGVPYLAELLGNLGFSYREARRGGALLLFGDEASFARRGSLGYPWAVRGDHPPVPACGKRRGDRVFGLSDYCSGRLFARGHDGRFTAERYRAFLAGVLAATAHPLVLVQDGARYHTAQDPQAFFAAHAGRLTAYQLPACSPAYNPLEHRWRSIKRKSTPSRAFPTFATLTEAVGTALAHLRAHPAEVQQPMGTYLDQMAALAQTAEMTNDPALAA